jgi:hypothetical protein
MIRALTLCLGVGLLLPSVTGCAGAQRERQLKESLRGFVSSVRWARWPAAAAQVAPKKRAAWLEQRLSAGPSLQITDVRLEDVHSREKEADVILSIGWYRLPQMSVHRSMWKQLWRIDDKVGWQLVEETRLEAKEPLRTTDMPEDPNWP